MPVKIGPGATRKTSVNKVDQEPSVEEQEAYDKLPTTSQRGEKLRSLFKVVQKEYRDQTRRKSPSSCVFYQSGARQASAQRDIENRPRFRRLFFLGVPNLSQN